MLQEIFIPQPSKRQVHLSDISGYEPVFVKDEKGKLAGMIVLDPKGWVIRLGGDNGLTGYHKEISECLESAVKAGYTCYVEEQADDN